QINKASSQVMRETILPKINSDVNSGKNFATLRQIYYSLILAAWFKQKFKESIYKHYIDKGKVKGIDLADKNAKDKIYNLYVEAFKKGIYNYIKTDTEPQTKRKIKRQYFSGGLGLDRVSSVLTIVDTQLSSTIASEVSKLDNPQRLLVNYASDTNSSETITSSAMSNDAVSSSLAQLTPEKIDEICKDVNEFIKKVFSKVTAQEITKYPIVLSKDGFTFQKNLHSSFSMGMSENVHQAIINRYPNWKQETFPSLALKEKMKERLLELTGVTEVVRAAVDEIVRSIVKVRSNLKKVSSYTQSSGEYTTCLKKDCGIVPFWPFVDLLKKPIMTVKAAITANDGWNENNVIEIPFSATEKEISNILLKATGISSPPMTNKQSGIDGIVSSSLNFDKQQQGGIDLQGIDVAASPASSSMNMPFPFFDLSNSKGLTFTVKIGILNLNTFFGIVSGEKEEKRSKLAYLKN
ncbi:MAG: hypothetical protein QMD94_02505, partial [Candidatus Omnitrophota bacterium]|nr:hypothetical protein [Candidatus Omnitrophota bacterium]